jgi:NAD(P)H-hydrate epimerase
MREIDRRSIEKYGISDQLLMESAGFEMTESFMRRFEIRGRVSVAVLCGGGNNGGDGFVLARLLRRKGLQPSVFLFVPEKKLKGAALENYKRLGLFNIPVHDLSGEQPFRSRKKELYLFDYLIDALLGIGFHGEPRGIMGEVIDTVNSCPGTVISVDLPSGLDADGGQPDTVQAVRARLTWTMGALKFGLVDFPGKRLAGEVEVLDIGFPPGCVEHAGGSAFFIDAGLADGLVPPRRADAHKGTYGHLGVIGGKPGYEGAALMACRAAARSGCGLVTLFTAPGGSPSKPDEVIRGDLPVGLLKLAEAADLEKLFERQDALVIGPGLGAFEGGYELIRRFLDLGKKLLIDADGINNLAGHLDVLKSCSADTVLTPHIGEMARLMDASTGDVKHGKQELAARLAGEYGVTVVLKDAVTVVAGGERLYLNDGGVSALAKGGSGDVLSGITGALLARGLNGTDAAVAGVFLHTQCGRAAEEFLYEDSVQAGDLIDRLPEAFRTMRGRDGS